ENGVTTAFLPHGLGHLLGLQVHDVGGRTPERLGETKRPPARHPYLRLTRTLEENMVVTIEPGIYFIEPLIEAFDRKTPGLIKRTALDTLARCGGIRIEDNLQVESRGYTNLTRIAFGE
ncbi:MAG: M24 family metallopeptidase, partial [Gammaproteobacteria bacterium]